MNNPDLLSLILTLSPVELPPAEKKIPSWWGSASHHLLIEAINSVDPNLAPQFHTDNEIRPFTTSTLHGLFSGHNLLLDGSYEIRFTALNQQIANIILKVAKEKETNGQSTGGIFTTASKVELDKIMFKVNSSTFDSKVHPLAGSTSYQDFATSYLLSPTPPPDTITIKFLSPTNFSSNNRLSTNGDHFPYPLPELVFGSLLDHWNACSTMNFPNELRMYAAKSLFISRFQLSSRKVKVAGGIQLGSVGYITFRTHNYDRYWMGLIHTLAHYAQFAGVGAKTAMGLGQCIFIDEIPNRQNS